MDLENNMRKLFRRCVQCPDTTPSCPACASDETCTLSSQTCDTCPSTSCIKTSISGPTSAPPSSGGSKAGPIAGGVVGGVVAIVIITLIIWKFYWKPRRAQYMGEEWPEEDASAEKNGQFTMQRNARASTHTIGSIASTVLTRASNVIQIAYIPGVTNRSATEMIPPVPPVPLGIHVDSARSSPRVEEEQHFFMPGDLRDSTYTGVSDLDGRSSFARTSIAPSLARSSVATTIYRDNAVVHMPAQAAYGGRANVVSVRFPGSSSGENTPPVPAIDYAKHGQKGLSVPDGADTKPPPSPAFSVGSTFLSSKADIAQAVTATPINLRTATKGNAKDEVLVSDASSVKTFGVQKSARNSTSNPTKDESRLSQSHDESIEAPFTLDDAFTEDEGGFLLIRTDGDEEPQASRASGVTEIEDASPLRSPFTDQAAVTSTDIPERRHSRTGSNGLENLGHRRRQSGSLTKVVEEASKDDREGLLSNSSHRNSSPFSDSNEVRGL